MAVNVLAMRGLGVDGYGEYGYVLTLVALFSFGSSMGLDRLLKREIARDPLSAGRYVATALGAAGVTSVATLVALIVVAWVLDGRTDVVISVALSASALGLQALAVVPNSYFHAVRRMGKIVAANLAGRVALVTATAAALWFGLGLRSVFTAQVLDGICVLLISAWVFRREAPGVRLATDRPAVWDLLRTAVPFGLNGLFATVYLSADVLLLAHFKDDAEVGVYRGGVLLITLFPFIAEVLTNGIFPRMANHLGNPEAAGAELRFAARVLLAVSLPAAVGGILLAEPLVVLLGGSEFARSALPFAIMAPLLPLRFLNNAFAMTLSALDRQDDRTKGVFIAAAFNVVANLLVLPRFGAIGAAATTLSTEILLFAWTSWWVRTLVVGVKLGDAGWRVAVAAGTMGVALWLLPPMHVVIQIIVGVGVFLAVALAVGAVRRGDLRRLRGV